MHKEGHFAILGALLTSVGQWGNGLWPALETERCFLGFIWAGVV